jgi:glycosyltransferase involved in cell wall biosynthesis
MNNLANLNATFVMPHLRNDSKQSKFFFDKALEGIFHQMDPNWQVVIIDDDSPSSEVKSYLLNLQDFYPEKIHVIFNEKNYGPGYSRNLGIQWAYEHQSPIVLFNDADDISHQRRLEIVRAIFKENINASVVYSTFKVIDENDNFVSPEKLTPSILEILEGHQNQPLQGQNIWIAIGIERGYTNLTSSTAVRTSLAYQYPFPEERVSEDSHTWFRYSAGGGEFVYASEIPTFYRIPQNTAGSATRSREGGKHQFYKQKAAVDLAGFTEAIEIALRRHRIYPQEINELLIKFYIKLAITMAREKEFDLASEHVLKAMELSGSTTRRILFEKGIVLQEENGFKVIF